MTPHPGRVLLIFLDGVGIGEDDEKRNPFVGAELPTLLHLLGGNPPTRTRPRVAAPNALAFPMDATLGVPGLPQSGTGQSTLLTGENTARMYGRHFGPWTPVSLRPLVEERSLLRLARDAGREVSFANAYPRGWPGPKGDRRVAAPPLAARGARVLSRDHEALGAGDAVASEIVNDGWRRQLGHDALPEVTEMEAGRNLAAIAAEADLTLYAHYSTDTAGHRGGLQGAREALERVDRFLGGVVEGLPDDVTLLITSDHGNIEDATAGHTLNPALGIAVGPGAERIAGTVRGIGDVTPAVLRHLAVSD